MRVPLEWLKQYVTIRLKPDALAHRLTMAGLEVTGIASVDGQPVFELEITPNRADCLSIVGVAREVAAITGQRLQPPSGQPRQSTARGPASTTPLAIRIEDRKGCSRYIGRVLTGVTIAPSPAWMQQRLSACGIRPINNVVDITNYVLLEYGQPLHAFDVKRLAQATIVVRRAAPNERITTLDGVTRTLSPEMLVIADARQAVAVAGVMGAMGSEVTPQTTDVLLESALFDPLTVRRTARALGLSSESSYRFERGVDPAGVETASARASSLIGELAGGTERLAKGVGAKPPSRRVITLDVQRASRWLGAPLSSTTVRTSLAQLSCRVASSGSGTTVQVSVPSFRRDLTSEVDLYEELARLIGYDRLAVATPSPDRIISARSPAASSSRPSSETYWRGQSLRCLCASLGLTETISWSLVSEADLSRCGVPVSEALRVANPLSHDHAYLRPTLLIGLLRTVRHNIAQGADGVRIFEVGRVASPSGQPMERTSVGLALSGLWARDWRTNQSSDLFRLKGLLETLIQRVCRQSIRVAPSAIPWVQPGHGIQILVDERPVGVAGQVATAVTRPLDLGQPVWIAELSVAALLDVRRPTGPVRAPSHLPPVKRDLSILVKDSIVFEDVDHAIREVGGTLAGRIDLIDRYTGTQLPPGTYSLTFSIDYRDPSRTLTASEVDQLHHRIGQALVERFGAQLR